MDGRQELNSIMHYSMNCNSDTCNTIRTQLVPRLQHIIMMQDYAASFQQIYRESNDIQYRDKADDLLSEIEYEISAYKLYKSQVIG